MWAQIIGAALKVKQAKDQADAASSQSGDDSFAHFAPPSQNQPNIGPDLNVNKPIGNSFGSTLKGLAKEGTQLMADGFKFRNQLRNEANGMKTDAVNNLLYGLGADKETFANPYKQNSTKLLSSIGSSVGSAMNSAGSSIGGLLSSIF